VSGSEADRGAGGPHPEPAGRLTLSGGSSSLVATDTVFVQLAALRRLHADTELWRDRVARIRALGVGPAPAWRPDDLGACLLTASVAIIAVAEQSAELADGLAEAAERYGRLERDLDGALRTAGAGIAYTVGLVCRLLAPVILLAAAGPALGVAAGSLLANLAAGRPASVLPPWFSAALAQSPELLTDPLTVSVVRALVSSADDVALGAVGMPYPLTVALGDDGIGLLGVPASALGVLTAARAAGMLRETPVRVHRVAGSSPGADPTAGSRAVPALGAPALGAATAGLPAAGAARAVDRRAEAQLSPPGPPAGFADLADRIPTEEDGGQVRIERYGDEANPAWLVYIGGTVEWNPSGSTEPWDMASNVAAVADQDAGSYRAVLQALEQAGVRPGDPVLPVAHSQGGLVAAELAARGDINAVGLVTFGAPASQVSLPDALPVIAVEHSDDLIPALGGAATESDTRLYVRRELYADTPVPAGVPLPAHHLVGYRDTARLLDGSVEPRLLAFREQLGHMVGTAAGQQSVWHAERLR
jgi:hypothetical protein